MFKAKVGYQIDDLGNSITDIEKDFDSKSKAQNWVEHMLNMAGDYDFAEVEEFKDEFDAQVEEFEAQEEARLEIGIPKNVL